MQLDSRLRGNDELRRGWIPTARHTANAIDFGGERCEPNAQTSGLSRENDAPAKAHG